MESRQTVAVIASDHFQALHPEWSDKEWNDYIAHESKCGLKEEKKEKKEKKDKLQYAATYKEMAEMFPALKDQELMADESVWILTLDPDTLTTRQSVAKGKEEKQEKEEKQKLQPNIVALLAQLLCVESGSGSGSESEYMDKGWMHPVIVGVTSEYLEAHRPSWANLESLLHFKT